MLNLDVSMTWDHMRQTYFSQAKHVTDIARHFWTDANLEHVKKETERLLTRETEMDVAIVPDFGFYSECERLCGQCANLEDVALGLHALNRAAVNDLVHLHLSSIKKRQLFMKQVINNDRLLFLPPPQVSNGRKRIIKPSTVAYMVQHNPNGRYNEAFKACLKNTRQYSQAPLFEAVTGYI
jgi:hypothetical protein